MIDEMTWKEFEAAALQKKTVLLPIGSLEQHGPQLPLGTDAIISRGIAKLVAKGGNCIVAPTIAYGYKPSIASAGWNFPGTCSVDGLTLTTTVKDVLKEILRHGFMHIVILDAHWENAGFVNEGVDLALRETKRDGAKILTVRWWEIISEETMNKIFPEGIIFSLEHASALETSLVWALAPNLVKVEKIKGDKAERTVEYTIQPIPSDVVSKSGVCSPKTPIATRERGEKLLKAIANRVAEIIQREFPVVSRKVKR